APLIGRRSCEAAHRILERRLQGQLLVPARNLVRQLLRSASLLRNLLPQFFTVGEVPTRWHDEARFRVDLTVKCLRNLRAVAARCDSEAGLLRLYRELRPQLQPLPLDVTDGSEEDKNPYLSLASSAGLRDSIALQEPYQRLLGLREADEDEEEAALACGRLHPIAQRLVSIATNPSQSAGEVAMVTQRRLAADALSTPACRDNWQPRRAGGSGGRSAAVVMPAG
uniref:Rubis-subs-bind domain-containing protein n=1 Tax=Macrostomum lignano TaxID=282301 RepID=A0A1I8IYZ3_9PLAT